MTPEQLKTKFPNASESFIRANSTPGCAPPGPEPQRAVRNDALAETPREKGHAARFRVDITSRRKRLIDPDNLCAKFFLDCLVRCGAIPGDSFCDIQYSIRQEKVAKCQEGTVIEVFRIK